MQYAQITLLIILSYFYKILHHLIFSWLRHWNTRRNQSEVLWLDLKKSRFIIIIFFSWKFFDLKPSWWTYHFCPIQGIYLWGWQKYFAKIFSMSTSVRIEDILCENLIWSVKADHVKKSKYRNGHVHWVLQVPGSHQGTSTQCSGLLDDDRRTHLRETICKDEYPNEIDIANW